MRQSSGPDYDVDDAFHAALQSVGPAAVPGADGDLFGAISEGKVSVVTDHIETFTETGIKLKSGAELEADIDRHRDRPVLRAARRR